MKKILAITLALALFASLALPAIANTESLTTEVTVATGGGNDPVVKCKWEQEPITDLESGDISHSTPGSQFLPPCVKDGKNLIEYYAVVTDSEDRGNVSQVYVDVYHPNCSPPPYNANSYFKYEIPFVKVGHGTAEQALVIAAEAAGLIKFDLAGGYDMDEVMYELDKGTADLWRGEALIDYEQPAGDYCVYCYAIDQNSNLSACLCNSFLYVGVACVEVDFNQIVYGSVSLGVEKMVPGDTDWCATAPQPAGEGQANGATIRNIGNTWAHPTIMQDDMGLHQDITGKWNVSFDARMGSDDAYKVLYDPYETATLPNYLDLSSQDELDLSIKVEKGDSGTTYSGTITIGATIEPFCP